MRGNDSLIEITLSLLTPYAAYILSDSVGASGVLAVVSAGLYSGWRDPLRMDPATRQTAFGVWSMVIFWLNGLAFVLLGLQFPKLLEAVHGEYPTSKLIVFCAVIAAVTMAAQIAWFFPGAYLPHLLSKHIRRTEVRPGWRVVLVAGWAGLRGAVTLAAALSIPLGLSDGSPFPGRDIVIFLAFGVIAATLLIQGTTTEWLIRKLGLREDGTKQKEERLARIAAVDAGLKALRANESEQAETEAAAALGHVVAEYEQRLAALTAEGESRTHARHRRAAEKRFRILALDAERATVDNLWRRNTSSPTQRSTVPSSNCWTMRIGCSAPCRRRLRKGRLFRNAESRATGSQKGISLGKNHRALAVLAQDAFAVLLLPSDYVFGSALA